MAMLIRNRRIRDLFVSVITLCLCFGISILLQDVFQIPEQVTTAFAFAVFLVSLLTDGYWWGIGASVASILLVNYAFTFPYFDLNFSIPSNFFSAVVMAVISIVTSALTTQIKRQETIKAETEREKMRANLLRAISHDLRTPLTTIYGSTTALRESGDTLTPEQKDRMLQGIQADSQWLVRMVENLLAVTRIDNGCGIPPERLGAIFTGNFENGNRPADNAKRNAGIGLSLCATIVHAHGGTIQAENDPSGGAVKTAPFSLPMIKGLCAIIAKDIIHSQEENIL